jgi:ABC-type taurine transport system substrate-binding protein
LFDIFQNQNSRQREDDMKSLNFRRIAAQLAVIGLSLAWVAPTNAQTTVKIGLAVPNYGPFAPVYAAEDLGYYKESGIKAEITAYRGGPVAQEALAAGSADIINFFPPGVALAVKKGIKERIVGIGSARPLGWHIVSMTSSPIRGLEDLAGKKVGVTAKGATSDFFALWGAKRAGDRDHSGRSACAHSYPQVWADRRRGAQLATIIPTHHPGRRPIPRRSWQGHGTDAAGRVGRDAVAYRQ